jgi:hypothetical protein
MQRPSKQKQTHAQGAEASPRKPIIIEIQDPITPDMVLVLSELVQWTRYWQLHSIVNKLVWELIITREAPLPHWDEKDKEDLFMLLQILEKLSKLS